jgi:hypothetical protein
MASPVYALPLYPVFHDVDGLPLDSGYIYIGAVNQNAEASPVQVYWDQDNTLPAIQPIRTINGYPSRNGSPGAIYVTGEYSITVRNSRRVLVYSSLRGVNFAEAATAILESVAQNVQTTWVATVATDTVPLAYNPGTRLPFVTINGLTQTQGVDFTIIADGGSPSGFSIQFTSELRVDDRVTYWVARAIAFDPNTTQVKSFDNRADLVAYILLYPAAEGFAYFDGTVWYRYSASATVISDLPDLVPVEPISYLHFPQTAPGLASAVTFGANTTTHLQGDLVAALPATYTSLLEYDDVSTLRWTHTGGSGDAKRTWAAQHGTHNGEALASLQANVEVLGNRNGPTEADYGMSLNIFKKGYGSGTALGGEIDALTIFVRQDGPQGLASGNIGSSDATGILINAQNRGDAGFIALFEGTSSNINASNVTTDSVQIQLGPQIRNASPSPVRYGFVAVAKSGTIDHAIHLNEEGAAVFTNLLNAPGKLRIERNGTYLPLVDITSNIGGPSNRIATASVLRGNLNRAFGGNNPSSWTGALTGSQGGFVPTTTEGASWAPRDSSFFIARDDGLMAVTGFASNTNILGTGGQETIGTSGFLINNKAGASGWAMYADVQHEVTAVGGFSTGLEVAAKNKGANVTGNPYALGAGVTGIWLSGGGDNTYGGLAANPSNAAIVIVENASTWNIGILFEADALTGADGTLGGGVAVAIGMATRHQIRWYMPDQSNGFTIRSDATTAGQNTLLLAGDNVLQCVGANGKAFAAFQHTASGVNYLTMQGQITGNSPSLFAAGDDTNIGIAITTKGTGVVNLSNANSRIQINGTQVVGLRQTGWTAPTGTATRTTFDTATVTLPQLAERVKALLDNLITHGLIGA